MQRRNSPFDIYEHPAFTEKPSRKEQAALCAVFGAAVAIVSTVAAVGLNVVPSPLVALGL
ncbi:hypothetical protein C8Q75DRAFT_808934 [Abortiporus biennis]|nr:hypothetical protein C8Q75DRAFT_808934 [Abortiporus biennis]